MVARAALFGLLLMAGACAPPPQTAERPAASSPTPDTGLTEPAETADPEDPGGSEPEGAWPPRMPAPLAVTEVGAAPHEGRVWVVGGLTADGQATASVQVYDPSADSWSAGADLPEPLHHASLVAAGGQLYVIGGYVGARFDQPTAAVRRLDPQARTWVEEALLPEARAAGAAAWDGRRIVYAGGVGPDGLAGDVLVLDGGSWRGIGALDQPREHLAAASDGQGTVWFLAGRTGGFETNLATVDVVVHDEVRPLGEVPTPRGGVAGFHAPGLGGCVAGGEGTAGTFNQVECIDVDGAVALLPTLAEARHGLGAAVIDGVAYTLVGGPEPGLFVSATVEALPLP
jgi:hypothetical protein